MEKYEKLFRGLEMCAGPECCTECPYHGETRGGKTCRAWLLKDAAVALADLSGRNEAQACDILRLEKVLSLKNERIDMLFFEKNGLRERVEELDAQKKPEPGLMDAVEGVTKLIADANYWHGQADALKWCMHDRFNGCVTSETVSLDLAGMSGEPEPEATDNV